MIYTVMAYAVTAGVLCDRNSHLHCCLGAQGQGFEPITTGMKFRDKDKEYVNLKSSQLGNFLIKNLMGIQGSLGGVVVRLVLGYDSRDIRLLVGRTYCRLWPTAPT